MNRLNRQEARIVQEVKGLGRLLQAVQAGPQMRPHPLHSKVELKEPTASSASSQRVVNTTAALTEASMAGKSPVGTMVQQAATLIRGAVTVLRVVLCSAFEGGF